MGRRKLIIDLDIENCFIIKPIQNEDLIKTVKTQLCSSNCSYHT
jgi:hypothetical protein